MKRNLIIVFALALMATACGKYEEGPSFSLRTKTARLANVWVAYESVVGGITTAYDNNSSYMEFTRDGKVTNTYTSAVGTMSYSGEWEWVDGKEKFKIKMEGETTWEESGKIIRLTNDELWLQHEDGSSETHFKTKE